MLNKTWEFIRFLVIPEQDMDDYSKLAGSYAIVNCSGKFLICYNKLRQQWEFPAGKRESDESAMQCAIRENDEIEKIMLWDLKENIGPFDKLDWAIITFI